MGTGEPCALVNNLRDLEEALQKRHRVVAMVFASWCPFCRRVLPVFEKQAHQSEQNLLLVADDEEHIADLYGIDVFPTLLLFEKGQIVKRLDGKPGLGLNEKQITDFIASCPLP
jgi:thioredoxin 1